MSETGQMFPAQLSPPGRRDESVVERPHGSSPMEAVELTDSLGADGESGGPQ